MTGRRVTTAATLAVMFVVLVVMAVVGYHAVTKPLPSLGSASASPTCSAAETTKTFYVRRGDVTVSVYNAGGASGLARRTLAKLEDAGFKAGAIGNAPAGTKVRRASVLSTKPDNASARLVARALGAKTPVVQTDESFGPGIDVYVGPKFRHLAAHAPHKMKLPTPKVTCVKVK